MSVEVGYHPVLLNKYIIFNTTKECLLFETYFLLMIIVRDFLKRAKNVYDPKTCVILFMPKFQGFCVQILLEDFVTSCMKLIAL